MILHRYFLPLALLSLLVPGIPGSMSAQESDADLVKAAQNPLANMISLPFQNSTNFGIGPHDRTQNVLNIQPVIPFFNGSLITRTIIPLVSQPDVAAESGSSFGFGDVVLTAFYASSEGATTWGVGPVLMFPTGGDGLGTKKWGIGPSAVALSTSGAWTLGGIVNNIWSYAGDEAAGDVNMLTFQPFINYNFPQWYLTCAPILTANWEAPSGQQWIVPLGLGAGKLFRVGDKKLPINVGVSAFDNVVKPDGGPDWQLRVQVSVLLPASIIGGGN